MTPNASWDQCKALAEKHTPGPWQIDDCPDANGFTTIRRAVPGSLHGDTEHNPIATVYADCDHDLISAAPELLEAVESLLFSKSGEEYNSAIDIARAAIAKARGQS